MNGGGGQASPRVLSGKMSLNNDSNSPHTSMAGKFIMVRHGESEGNRERRFTLSSEVPLTEAGIHQAHQVAQRIARHFKPEIIVSSPFRRARHTSQIIAAEFPLP